MNLTFKQSTDLLWSYSCKKKICRQQILTTALDFLSCFFSFVLFYRTWISDFTAKTNPNQATAGSKQHSFTVVFCDNRNSACISKEGNWNYQTIAEHSNSPLRWVSFADHPKCCNTVSVTCPLVDSVQDLSFVVLS